MRTTAPQQVRIQMSADSKKPFLLHLIGLINPQAESDGKRVNLSSPFPPGQRTLLITGAVSSDADKKALGWPSRPGGAELPPGS